MSLIDQHIFALRRVPPVIEDDVRPRMALMAMAENAAATPPESAQEERAEARRERVAQMLASGIKPKTIATMLGVSYSTVTDDIRRIGRA